MEYYMSWFPTGTDLAYRMCINNTSPRPFYVYHSTGMLSVIPGAFDNTGEEFGRITFEYSFKSPNGRADRLLEPANPDELDDVRTSLVKMSSALAAESGMYPSERIPGVSGDCKVTIKYAEDQFNKVYLLRSFGIVCSFNKNRLLERLGNEGHVLSAPLQRDPEVVEYTQSPSAIHRIFMKDSVGRFSSLWTTMSGQAVSIPNQRDFDGADGIYSTVIVNGELVRNDMIRFADFATHADLLKKLQELDIHPSEHDAMQSRTSKLIQSRLDAADKVVAELDKTKEELRKSKLEVEELKRLRVRDREQMDDLKSDSRKNSLLDWLKAGMGWFGIEIKRFFLGKLLFM